MTKEKHPKDDVQGSVIASLSGFCKFHTFRVRGVL